MPAGRRRRSAVEKQSALQPSGRLWPCLCVGGGVSLSLGLATALFFARPKYRALFFGQLYSAPREGTATVTSSVGESLAEVAVGATTGAATAASFSSSPNDVEARPGAAAAALSSSPTSQAGDRANTSACLAGHTNLQKVVLRDWRQPQKLGAWDLVTDEILGGVYPLNDEMIGYGWRFGSAENMPGILEKLVSGEPITAMSIGGSFTKGHGCYYGHLRNKQCNWASRVTRWMAAAFPSSQVVWHDEAQGGAPSLVFLGGLGARLKSLDPKPDLVFVDTSVNDATMPARGSRLKGGTKEAQGAGYEALIRAFHQLLPKAQIIIITDGCNGCKDAATSEAQVAEHYKLPILDYFSLAEKYNKGAAAVTEGPDRLWPQVLGYGDLHWVPNFVPNVSIRYKHADEFWEN
eukprot:TRINITY_DN50021_c0_g1_i3.p1 TRINITY_DN50021_c0_g1~~TRINITY_DN50021_c0_g1_i3.p1  ORF type:complete len:406 (+),score=54.43 TRINITY_DN50021_c0_g1_i3:248-1465(+)